MPTKAEIEDQLEALREEMKELRGQLTILRDAAEAAVMDLAFNHNTLSVRSDIREALFGVDGFTKSTLKDVAELDLSAHQVISMQGLPFERIQPQMGINYACMVDGQRMNLAQGVPVYVRRR